MSRPISSSRGLVAACLATTALMAGAIPTFALPSKVRVIEKVRPTAGRASEIFITGSLHDLEAVGLRSVEVEYIEEIDEEIVVVTLDAIPASGDRQFAYPIELPPMAEGQPSLGVQARMVGQTRVTMEAGDYFFVHAPITVDLVAPVPGSNGLGHLRIFSGGSQMFLYDYPVRLEGNHIKVGISYNCVILCEPPPAEWQLNTRSFGPLAPGVYTVELVNQEAFLPDAEIAYRGQVEVPGVPDDRILLRQGRFEVEMELHPPHQEIPRLVMPPTEDSALFYFFSPDNWEAMVKVLDGCALNGKYWVFGAASTDVGYTLKVKDLANAGAVSEYRHEAGSPAPALTDIDAFPCD